MLRAALRTLIVACLGLSAGLGLAVSAEARTFVAVGVGVPLFYPGPYYPAPYYYPPYAPPPVVYSPPPVVYSPPPVVYAQPAPYAAQTAQYWYYCDNPAGYYPYVQTCSSSWRQVPATPSPGSSSGH